MNEDKFTGRAAVYGKYRPTYPRAYIEYLYSAVGFSPGCAIADMGAGTGIFSRLLLEKGSRVTVVEPNADMLSKAKEILAEFPNCDFIQASAENPGLPDKSVDFVTAAQSFHWFDRAAFKRECQRILKSSGKVALVWNSRDRTSEITKENEAINRQLCPKFAGFSGGSAENPKDYADFFKDGRCEFRTFDCELNFDKDSFIGRSLSGSYAPLPNEPTYAAYREKMGELFEKYGRNGTLILKNIVRSYVGEV